MKKRCLLLFLCLSFLFYLIPAASQPVQAYDLPNGNVVKSFEENREPLAGTVVIEREYFGSFTIYNDQRDNNSPFTRAVMHVCYYPSVSSLYMVLIAVGTDGCVTDDIAANLWFCTDSHNTKEKVNQISVTPKSNGMDKVLNDMTYILNDSFIFSNSYVNPKGNYFVCEVAVLLNGDFSGMFLDSQAEVGFQFMVSSKSTGVNYLIGGWYAQTKARFSSEVPSGGSDVAYADVPVHQQFFHSITVSWNTPSFTLTYGNWNTDTHKYDSKSVTGQNTVNVTNNSKLLDLTVAANYSRAGPWQNYFEGTVSGGTVRISPLGSTSYTLTLTANGSTPSTLSGTQQAGNFTVTVSSPYQ